jgi:hypothetical protein
VVFVYPVSRSKCPVRTVQTPVVTVGRFTIERIDPHGSLGALGDGAGEGDAGGVLDGAGAGCACAGPVATMAQAKMTVARSAMRLITLLIIRIGPELGQPSSG